MPVNLTPQHEALIRDKVAAGLYGSAEEAVATAVRLLDARDRAVQELRVKIQIGIDSGEGVELTPELMDEIDRKAEAAFHRGAVPHPDVCP
jgi:putative addiction module CopG family antidote